MKKLLVALTLITFLGSVPLAMARSKHRAVIDRKWKAVEKWEKARDQAFKAIECEGAQRIESLEFQRGKPKPRN